MLSTWWVKPLIYLAAVAALGGALWWLHHHIYTQGYDAGKAEITAQYAARDKAAEAAAQARIRELETQRIAIERAHADALNLIGTKLLQEQQNAQKNEAVLRARLAAGTLRLRDPGDPSANAGCVSGVREAPAAPSGSDGGKGSDVRDEVAGVLSDAASQFLVGLAGEADAVARQLAACQDVIRSDRK